MKVILLEDVKALGKKGQVVEVSDGYAKNFILKKTLGLEATGANMKRFETPESERRKGCAAAARRCKRAGGFAGRKIRNPVDQGWRGRKGIRLRIQQGNRSCLQGAVQYGN